MAVISLGGIVYSRSVRVAGDRMDEAIVEHIKRRYNLLIGTATAEIIKTTIGNAFPSDQIETIEVKGRDLVTGIPKILTIDSDEVRDAISDQIHTIVETVRTALEQMPPELAADLIDTGIMLTGGGALLKDLDALLRSETKLPIHISEDPALGRCRGRRKGPPQSLHPEEPGGKRLGKGARQHGAREEVFIPARFREPCTVGREPPSLPTSRDFSRTRRPNRPSQGHQHHDRQDRTAQDIDEPQPQHGYQGIGEQGSYGAREISHREKDPHLPAPLTLAGKIPHKGG